MTHARRVTDGTRPTHLLTITLLKNKYGLKIKKRNGLGNIVGTFGSRILKTTTTFYCSLFFSFIMQTFSSFEYLKFNLSSSALRIYDFSDVNVEGIRGYVRPYITRKWGRRNPHRRYLYRGENPYSENFFFGIENKASFISRLFSSRPIRACAIFRT